VIGVSNPDLKLKPVNDRPMFNRRRPQGQRASNQKMPRCGIGPVKQERPKWDQRPPSSRGGRGSSGRERTTSGARFYVLSGSQPTPVQIKTGNQRRRL